MSSKSQYKARINKAEIQIGLSLLLRSWIVSQITNENRKFFEDFIIN